MQEPTGIPAGAHDDESQSIMEEVRRQMGYAPPSMLAVMNEPAALRVAWAAVRLGFIDNPLPQLFKQQLLMLVARESVAYQGVVVVGSALRRSGMASADILALLNEPIPSLSVICQRLRTASRQWAYPSTWAMMPAELEKCVLMASVRLAVRRDRGGRCAQLLRELLGDVQFNAMLLLTSFAGLQQASFAARSGSDEGLTAEYDAMLADAPDLAKSWEDAARKLTRHRVSKRERKLMAEIGRQDRIREALRQSERRFRRIVENAAFPLMIYAEDGEVVMLNRAWEQLSGWDRKAIPDVQT